MRIFIHADVDVGLVVRGVGIVRDTVQLLLTAVLLHIRRGHILIGTDGHKAMVEHVVLPVAVGRIEARGHVITDAGRTVIGGNLTHRRGIVGFKLRLIGALGTLRDYLVYLAATAVGELVETRRTPVGTLHISVVAGMERGVDKVGAVEGLVIARNADVTVLVAAALRLGGGGELVDDMVHGVDGQSTQV